MATNCKVSQKDGWLRHPTNCNFVQKVLNGQLAQVRIKPDRKGYLWAWGKAYGYAEDVDEAKVSAMAVALGIV